MKKKGFWYRLIFIFLALILASGMFVAACGGGGGEKETPTVTTTPTTTPIETSISTTTPTITTTPTPTPTEGPVKIGVILPWSGALGMAGLLADRVMAVVQDQLKNQGGILGGREVEFVKRDDRGVVAEAVGQAKKLALEEIVAFITCGGVSAASFAAVAQAAEEVKIPYVAYATIFGVADMKYCAALWSNEPFINRIARFLIDVVKPKTVAWLAYDLEDGHDMINGVEGVPGFRERLKAEGIDVVYEQYFSLDTADFSPYLTKIKYVNPDVLLTCLNGVGQTTAILKQIMELGGWGSMKYFCVSEAGTSKNILTWPAALGTYASVLWLPGSDDPGMKTFEDAYVQHFNSEPDPNLSYFYNAFWAAIKAIELAGTDKPEQVAAALRSGNLEWDSAWGHIRIKTDGIGETTMMVAQIQEGGKLVKVWPK